MTINTTIADLKWNENGLIPAIVQNDQTAQVLMLAWMNRESLQRTLISGQTWFWSRSRRELWHKGDTSGNIQIVTSVFYDCDGDTLLIKVIPAGPACHTGKQSCFFNSIDLLTQENPSPNQKGENPCP